MWNGVKFALRGALGFGLGGGLLFAAVYFTSRPADRKEEPISFVGEWQGSHSSINSARFNEDGTFRFLTFKGKRTTGTYLVTDATKAELISDGPWKRALLVPNPDYPGMASTELLVEDEKGSVVRLDWFRKSPPSPRDSKGDSLLGFLFIPFISGAIGGIFLTLGTNRVARGALGFGCASVPAAFIVLFTLISLQGGGKPDYGWGALGCGAAFGMVGAVGGLAIKPGLLLPGALSFGLAGAVWGVLVFWMVADGAPADGVADTLLSVIALLAPIVIAGGLLGGVVGLVGVDD